VWPRTRALGWVRDTRARGAAPASRVAATARCPSCVCFVGVPACERGCPFSRPGHGGRCGETAALLLEWNGAYSGCVAPQSVVVRTPVRFWLSLGSFTAVVLVSLVAEAPVVPTSS